MALRGRYLKKGINLGLAIILFGMILVYVNYIGARHYARFDMTESKFYSLSEKFKTILRDLDQDVEAYLIFTPVDHDTGQSNVMTSVLYKNLQYLVKEIKNITAKIVFEEIDPYRQIALTQELKTNYNLENSNIVLLVRGDQHKIIPAEDFASYDFSPAEFGSLPVMTEFHGEETFASALLELTQTLQKRIAFTTGHGELDTDGMAPGGAAAAYAALIRDNFDCGVLNLLGVETVDPGIDLLIIAGPTKAFLPDELHRLEEYVSLGGCLMLCLDPLIETGLETFCDNQGVVIGTDIVIDPEKKIPFISAANLIVDNYSRTHQITRPMKGIACLFPLARSVRLKDNLPEGTIATILAQTSSAGWAETNLAEEEFRFDEHEDRKGPVGVALSIELHNNARIALYGNSQFITNAHFQSLGNGDLFVNTVHWLVRKENLISISPKTPEHAVLSLDQAKMRNIFFQAVLGLPIMTLIIGSIVWFRRRS